MSTEQKLTAHAKDWEAVHLPNELATPDWIIIRDQAIHRAWVTLDMRYRTYAEDSWTADVLRYVEQTKSCSCEDCEQWGIREVQIIEEVRREMSRSLVKVKENAHV